MVKSRKEKNRVKYNRGDWSGKEVIVYNDGSFEFFDNRYWFSNSGDDFSGDHIHVFTTKEKAELDSGDVEYSDDDRPMYVYGEGWDDSICALIKIGSQWTATAHGGDMTRDSEDPMEAAVQLLCNIV